MSAEYRVPSTEYTVRSTQFPVHLHRGADWQLHRFGTVYSVLCTRYYVLRTRDLPPLASKSPQDIPCPFASGCTPSCKHRRNKPHAELYSRNHAADGARRPGRLRRLLDHRASFLPGVFHLGQSAGDDLRRRPSGRSASASASRCTRCRCAIRCGWPARLPRPTSSRNGRLETGLGRGHAWLFERSGVDLAESRGRFDEAVEILIAPGRRTVSATRANTTASRI